MRQKLSNKYILTVISRIAVHPWVSLCAQTKKSVHSAGSLDPNTDITTVSCFCLSCYVFFPWQKQESWANLNIKFMHYLDLPCQKRKSQYFHLQNFQKVENDGITNPFTWFRSDVLGIYMVLQAVFMKIPLNFYRVTSLLPTLNKQQTTTETKQHFQTHRELDILKRVSAFFFFLKHLILNNPFWIFLPFSVVGHLQLKVGPVQLPDYKGAPQAGQRPGKLLTDTSLLQQTSTIGLAIASSTSIHQVRY